MILIHVQNYPGVKERLRVVRNVELEVPPATVKMAGREVIALASDVDTGGDP